MLYVKICYMLGYMLTYVNICYMLRYVIYFVGTPLTVSNFLLRTKLFSFLKNISVFQTE